MTTLMKIAATVSDNHKYLKLLVEPFENRGVKTYVVPIFKDWNEIECYEIYIEKESNKM